MFKIVKAIVVLFLIASTLFAMAPTPAAAAVQPELESDPDRIWDVANADPDVFHTGRIRALVWDFQEYQGRMYVGGKFLNLVAPDGSTRDQAYLAAFDVATGEWIESFDPQLDGAVYALEMTQDGRLLAGGELTGGVVALDPATGSVDAGFNAGIDLGERRRAIFDIDVIGNSAYVGGRFASAQGVDLLNLGKFNTQTGAIDANWTPRAEFDTGTPRIAGQLVYGVEVDTSRDRVYVVGKFGSIDGNLDAAYFATLDETTGAVRNDVPQGLPPETLNHREGFSMWHHDVLFRGDKVYIGGQGHQTLILNVDDLTPTHSFFTNRGVGDNAAGGDTQAMFLGETTLWSGCHCWGSVGPYELGSYNGENANGMQSYDEYRRWVVDFRDVNPFGQQRVRGGYGVDIGSQQLSQQSFNLSGQGGAWALYEDSGGRLWMGGQFATGNGRVGEGIARFSPIGATNLEAVASCTATSDGDTVTVSWDAAANATDYVVYRTVDDDPRQFWRGKTSGLSFDDTSRDADLAYFVASARGNERASRTACSNDIEPPGDELAAVAACAVTGVGNDVTVSWDAADGAEEYVVYRTVDGSRQFWRGVTASLSFDDTLRAGDIDYFVASKQGGERTDATACD